MVSTVKYVKKHFLSNWILKIDLSIVSHKGAHCSSHSGKSPIEKIAADQHLYCAFFTLLKWLDKEPGTYVCMVARNILRH